MSDVELRELLVRYQQLKAVPKGKEAGRGRQFNAFLRDLLRVWGLEAHADQRGIRNRDETDVGFSIGRAYYILEAKWEKKPINLDPVAKLYLRLKVRPPGTAAVLVSMSGFTKPVREFTEYHPEIILLDRTHIEAMLTGLVDPDQLLHSLFSWTSRRGGSYVALDRLLASPYMPSPSVWSDPGDSLPIAQTADGAHVTPLLMLEQPNVDHPFTGMIAADDGTVLLTCDLGVLRLDPGSGESRWELPLGGCFGPAVFDGQGGLHVLCESAVVRRHGGKLTASAGAFRPRSQLLSGPAGERWVFSTTGPTGHPYYGSHTLTRVGDHPGEEEAFQLTFSGQVKQAAITGADTLYFASTFYAAEVAIADGMQVRLEAGMTEAFEANLFSETTAVHRFGMHTMISAGRVNHEAAIWMTDLQTREHTRLALVPAAGVSALAVRGDGSCLALVNAWESNWLDRSARTRPVLVSLGLPRTAA